MHQRDIVNKVKTGPQNEEKISANHKPDKDLISRTYEEFI
jgi:hypothetical protein